MLSDSLEDADVVVDVYRRAQIPDTDESRKKLVSNQSICSYQKATFRSKIMNHNLASQRDSWLRYRRCMGGKGEFLSLL